MDQGIVFYEWQRMIKGKAYHQKDGKTKKSRKLGKDKEH